MLLLLELYVKTKSVIMFLREIFRRRRILCKIVINVMMEVNVK